MRIYRLEFGLVKTETNKIPWFDRPERYHNICGCAIYSFSGFYVTWLGDECYSDLKIK